MNFFEKIKNVWDVGGKTLLSGVGNTLLLALVGTIFGLIIGLIVGVIRTIPDSRNKFVQAIQKIANGIFTIYIEVFRGTPMMVQAMVIYYGYSYLHGGASLDPIVSGMFIVSINTGAYMSEIIRGGFLSIDKGQKEGAKSIGMNHTKTMFYVVIPQTFKNIIPSITNEFIINIKDTSVLNIIYVSELFFMAKKIGGMTSSYFETYLITSFIYLCMTLSISIILRLVERMIKGKNHYTILGSQSDSKAEIHVENGAI